MTSPVLVDQRDLPEEHWQSLKQGSIRWKPLLSGNSNATNRFDCGISVMHPREFSALHSDMQPNVCFGVEGAAHRLKPSVALFIQVNAVHDVLAADQILHGFPTFAAEACSDIDYTFA